MADAPKGPAYRRLAADLRALILSGEIQPDGELPSIAEIHARFGDSDTVIRSALRELDAEGIIMTRQGKRALVLRRPDQPDERHSAEYLELKQLLCDLREEVRVLRAEVEGNRGAP